MSYQDYLKIVFNDLKALYKKAIDVGVEFEPNEFTKRMDMPFNKLYGHYIAKYQSVTEGQDKFNWWIMEQSETLLKLINEQETINIQEYETERAMLKDIEEAKNELHKTKIEDLEDFEAKKFIFNDSQIKTESPDLELPSEMEQANPTDVFNEIVNDAGNKEYLKQIPELVQEASVESDGIDKFIDYVKTFKFDETNNRLKIYFKKNSTLFQIKEAIKECINNNSKDDLIVKIWFRNPFEKNKIEFRTVCLANEQGFNKMVNLLEGDEVFKLQEHWDENHLIAVSDDNGEVEWKILAKDVIGLIIEFKGGLKHSDGGNGRVYKDNGGKFYKYKINEKYIENNELIEKLKRYQIFKSLKDNKKEFEINCLVYALKMSGLFDESEINHFKTICYDRYVHMSDVDKLGKEMNIKFKIIKL